MPDWCHTAYVIEGGKEEIEDLYNKLLTLEQMPKADPSYFGHYWLGNVISLFGGDPVFVSKFIVAPSVGL